MWQSSWCARCIGLRAWKATTFFQPRWAISSRISTAVPNVSGKSAWKSLKLRTCIGPQTAYLPRLT